MSSPKSLKLFSWSVIKAKAQERCSEVRKSQWSKESLGAEAPGREEELEEGGLKDCLVLLVPVLAGVMEITVYRMQGAQTKTPTVHTKTQPKQRAD